VSARINGISSMATRALLADLADAYRERTGIALGIEAVGGVDAAKRVQAGEPFDIVVLAADAIDRLVASGQVVAGSKADIVQSGVAVAVRTGASRPDIGSEAALRQSVLCARTVGYSTGPSGVALTKLFDGWGINDSLKGRLVQAPPGVPVGALVARGDVELGFQQLSELMHLDGIDVLGPMPESIQIVTTFSAGRCRASAQPEAVDALLRFMTSPTTAEAKRRNGMTPA
jgi:molybdate transport system substrate-binding protein